MVKDCKVTVNIINNTVQKTWLTNHEEDKNRCIGTFNHELTCLTALQENFVNDPGINHYPFPKIISANQNTNTITMTYCGMSVYEIKKASYKSIRPINLHNTVECIINNLKIAGVKHGDIWTKNVCMDKNGHVHLIDFDKEGVGKNAPAIHFSKNGDFIVKKHCISWYNKNYYTKPVLSELKMKLEKDTAWNKWKYTPWSILYMF